MRIRSLGVVVAMLANMLAGSAGAQTCRDVLTELPTDSEHEGPLLWIGERALLGQPGPDCGEWQEMLAAKRECLRPIGRCSVRDEETRPWLGAEPGQPRLSADWGKNSEIVLVGRVVETEPGLSGFGGYVITLVRARVTEVIHDSSSRAAAWEEFSFLVFGGRLVIDGDTYCSDTPPSEFQWRPGDVAVVSGIAGYASDSNLVGLDGIPLRVMDGRAHPPDAWSPVGGSLGLEEIRAAFGAEKP